MLVTRKQCRHALTTYLKADLSSLVDPSWVLPYQLVEFDGASPVVLVTSAGVDPTPMTMKGSKTSYFAGIEAFVLTESEDGTWTRDMAEDRLDDICDVVLDTVAKHRKDGPWQSLMVIERTLVIVVKIAGLTYLHEVYPIVMEVL